MAQRITRKLNKEELYDEGTALESELNVALDQIAEQEETIAGLRTEVEQFNRLSEQMHVSSHEEAELAEEEIVKLDKENDRLNDENDSLRARVTELEARNNEVESVLEQIAEQQEAGKIPGQTCETCPAVSDETRVKRPNVARAISHLREYDKSRGLPRLREAERFIRAELSQQRRAS